MEIKTYLEQKKELYDNLLEFIEGYDLIEEKLELLINCINYEKEEFEHFLRLLTNLVSHYHRDDGFVEKVETILDSIKNEIKQTFSNYELIDIFQNNKLMLLLLFQKEIIIFDEYIYNFIIDRVDVNGTKYSHFFLPEIKKFATEEILLMIEKEIKDSNFYQDFDEKRRLGENDHYICRLIRQDLVEEFIAYVNRYNISLSSIIERSTFETNSYLIENEPTLIEYAAFHGSIQIFQFLRMSQVELNENLWFYVIHGKNAELIHLLEGEKVDGPDESYENCIFEAIKCHHNDIANYFEENLILNVPKSKNYQNKIESSVVNYSNYSYFLNGFQKNTTFFDLCKYKYSKIVDLYLQNQKNEINLKTISTKCFKLDFKINYLLIQFQFFNIFE